jgi:hypothetical protein
MAALTVDEFLDWMEGVARVLPAAAPLAVLARLVRKYPAHFHADVAGLVPAAERRMREPERQAKWRKMGIPIPASLRIRTPEPERRTPPPAPALGIEEARRILAHAVEKFRDWRSSQAAVPA